MCDVFEADASCAGMAAGSNHFRMVTISIPPETAPANPENPWQKVLTDGHASLGQGAAVVSVFALGATMQDV